MVRPGRRRSPRPGIPLFGTWGSTHQPQVLVGGVADDDGHGGVGHPAVDPQCEIHAQHVPVAQGVVVRETVQDGVVDGQADDAA